MKNICNIVTRLSFEVFSLSKSLDQSIKIPNPKISFEIFFLKQIFLDKIFFGTKTFLGPKIFLDPKIFFGLDIFCMKYILP